MIVPGSIGVTWGNYNDHNDSRRTLRSFQAENEPMQKGSLLDWKNNWDGFVGFWISCMEKWYPPKS